MTALALYRGGVPAVTSNPGTALAVRAQTLPATQRSSAVGFWDDPNIIDVAFTTETATMRGHRLTAGGSGGGGGRGAGGGGGTPQLPGSGPGGGPLLLTDGGRGAGGGPDIFNFKTGGDASWFGSMMDAGGVRAAFAGAMIGGTASYATGGEFGAGALAGGSMAFGARAIHQSLKANSKFLSKGIQNAAGGEGMRAWAAQQVMNHQSSIQTVQQRHAMMAGAGLFGVVGGGERNRNNHRRGFNAHRGNAF